MILAALLSLLAAASWTIDFSPIADWVWFVRKPAGTPRDLLLGAGICLGFTLSASLAWLAVLAAELVG